MLYPLGNPAMLSDGLLRAESVANNTAANAVTLAARVSARVFNGKRLLLHHVMQQILFPFNGDASSAWASGA